MENRRFFLIALLAVVGFFLYQAWQHDYPAKPASTTPASTPAASTVTAEAPTVATPEVAKAPEAPVAAVSPQAEAGRVRVETDRFVAEISQQGGDLRQLRLLGYPVSKAKPDVPFALLDDAGGKLMVLQSGLAGEGRPLATHETRYTSPADRYALGADQASLDVVLEHTAADGTIIRKTYQFRRDSYEVVLTQTLVNRSDAAVAASSYVRFLSAAEGTVPDPPFVQSFRGVGIYQRKEGSDKYTFQQFAFEDLDDAPFEVRQQGGWVAILQPYFLAAVLPPPDESVILSGRSASGTGYVGQYVGPLVSVAPQAERSFATRLYLGPNLQGGAVNKIAPGLELTQDYGLLTPICEALFFVLSWLYKVTHNWGVAIILLTLVVRAAMYKLSEAQYRSMAKMKKFAPRIQEIKERYGEDRERLNKAMMDLYKKEGFNPLAGCWPLLVQFPVFIALYWVLSQSVELRQADFWLWIKDLSAADPYYVLPLLFGGTMWAQQKLSGQTMPDPMQQRIMNLMPIMMTAFFAFFPAGLVLYWFVSNLTGLAQQWYITRKLQRLGLA
jgi:YidC/Oxa1 family membrane protein insertase